VACLLGGHGIPAEVGIAAFEALKRTGLLSCTDVSVDDISQELSQPIQMHNGKLLKYRFAKQKSQYIAKLLASNIDVNGYSSHRELRDDLMNLPGFGFKTASWVVRNWFDSDLVAILDIHIHRAGILAGFFDPSHSLPKDYLLMERRFLAFAVLIGVRPSILDAIMWEHLKRDGNLVFSCLNISKAA
jgi:thermostable 8-oxoguanine DNA glycosylase